MKELALLLIFLAVMLWGYRTMTGVDDFLEKVRRERRGQEPTDGRESENKKTAASCSAEYGEAAS